MGNLGTKLIPFWKTKWKLKWSQASIFYELGVRTGWFIIQMMAQRDARSTAATGWSAFCAII